MGSAPTAAQKRRKFSCTFSAVSPRPTPRFSESHGAGLTPPGRVEKPWQTAPASKSVLVCQSRAPLRFVSNDIVSPFGEGAYRPQHCFYFLPEPQGHGSLRPIFLTLRGCFFTVPSPPTFSVMPEATRSRLISSSFFTRTEYRRRTVSS